MALHPGSWITRELRLVRRIARGGMGSVWMADHVTLGEAVAVKFISGPLAADKGMLARFWREGKVAAELRSRHSVHIYEQALLPDGTPYIAMELLHGESLSHHLRARGPLSIADTLTVVAQLAEVLDEAHAAGVVHRDVKPGNVFLVAGPAPFVKLLDFGIAKRVQAGESVVTDTDELLGTPDYMSPEQLRQSWRVDRRADIWSLAVVAYHALVGAVPFAGESTAVRCQSICSGRFARPHDVDPAWPPALDAVFGKAFDANIDRRFATVSALVVALREALHGLAHEALAHGRLPTDAEITLVRDDESGPPSDQLATVIIRPGADE